VRNIISLLFLLLLFPSVSHAWWNDDWSFRKSLTVDTTPGTGVDIQSNPADVPVLVRLHTGNFGYFLDVATNGTDIRFLAADDKTPLKFHIEKFDSINEMALIWVKLPSLTGASNTEKIWMYYGNKSVVKSEPSDATYDAHQSLVYHFDLNSGTQGNVSQDSIPQDKTAYKNNPAIFTAEINSAAIIGSGARFKGNGLISIPPTPSLRIMPDKGWTFSSWIKITQPQDDAYIFNLRDGERSLTLGINNTLLYAQLKDAKNTFRTPEGATLSPGVWHHVTVIVGNGRIELYLNGIVVARTPIALTEMGGTITVGTTAEGGKHYFVGDLDELQISNTARATDWIKAQAVSQAPTSKLFIYGEDEQSQSGGGGSYFGIILQNVTVDGWAVIGVLIIMAMISWVVMFNKGTVISRVRRDNQVFLKQFKNLGLQGLTNLDDDEYGKKADLQRSPLQAPLQEKLNKPDQFESSTLYQLYHAGIREVEARIGRTVGAQASAINSHGINAIRAELDATQIREIQKLNSQMVLLTIAISGGPFLGLLGTVVGVMITFAAIAATGEVNINAIAPGIAAALVATVAGLVVAIPALFAYNYLGTRIKEISADMRVFVDEFVTRIAEQYGS